MSKRNLILLIIVLIIVVVAIFGVFYLYQPNNQGGETTEGTNFFADFLPFEKSKKINTTDTTNTTDISGYEETINTEIQNSPLKKVSGFPVAGFGVFIKERFTPTEVGAPTQVGEDSKNTKPTAPLTEFVPALRYVSRETGNIYQTFADKLEERKFSSTIIPKVYEASFGNNGESVVMRYLKTDNRTIETYVGTLQKEYLGADSVGTNEIKGFFLPENITETSLSSDASKLFYLFNIEDSSVGVTFSLQSSTKVQIFDSPFTEWLSFWPNNKMITLTTKPSANVAGYMYAINPDKKDFTKILGGINGLTTLTSPDGKMVLYSDNTLSLNIFDTETRSSSPLGVKTLPEKCIWAPTNDTVYCAVPKFTNEVQYPDSWYQGETSFSDEFWKIDVTKGNTVLLLDPVSVSGGEEIDGIKLALDQNQNFLFFINKKDSHLWELKLR